MSNFPAELTGTWEIDPGHSTIGFAVKHAMVSTTRGHFATFSGTATIDAANPEASSADLEIDATSIVTGNEQRDGHLRSADFWDADNNPKITFKSTSAKLDGDDLVLVGDLTIKGVAKPVEIKWEFNGLAADPWGTQKAGFDGTATINRSDWGISWNTALETGGFLISDKVKLVLEIEANKKA
ncbi:YceI family protein [Kineosporia mesophila]|uniref:YceI family protein n=1 Tax=Kineosporia mesophila TaxID=566012 RepID=A0ABP6ZGY0_9ACTN|nr:YceI family protein [Kineosporia mesophila]MCD5350436.1 YceI family protein [Kineosporia mesophila]